MSGLTWHDVRERIFVHLLPTNSAHQAAFVFDGIGVVMAVPEPHGRIRVLTTEEIAGLQVSPDAVMEAAIQNALSLKTFPIYQAGNGHDSIYLFVGLAAAGRAFAFASHTQSCLFAPFSTTLAVVAAPGTQAQATLCTLDFAMAARERILRGKVLFPELMLSPFVYTFRHGVMQMGPTLGTAPARKNPVSLDEFRKLRRRVPAQA